MRVFIYTWKDFLDPIQELFVTEELRNPDVMYFHLKGVLVVLDLEDTFKEDPAQRVTILL